MKIGESGEDAIAHEGVGSASGSEIIWRCISLNAFCRPV